MQEGRLTPMLPYTICFIRHEDRVLMLNREREPWMGMWNGVGGKLERGESPEAGVIREVEEETGIRLALAAFKGVVTWIVDGSERGGMYAFVADLPAGTRCDTPKPTDEGILDWKRLDWLLHPGNGGVSNARYYLSTLLNDERLFEIRFRYDSGEQVGFEMLPLPARYADVRAAATS